MSLSSDSRNREIRLIARPRPTVTEALFQLVEGPVPQPGPGELLIRVLYLSLEPAMRGWVSDAPNYRQPLPLNEVMFGFTVGQVAASNHPDYAVGDLVAGRQGWREWAVSDGRDIDRKLAPASFPVTCHLHLLGLTGVTAYLGLLEVGQPKAGAHRGRRDKPRPKAGAMCSSFGVTLLAGSKSTASPEGLQGESCRATGARIV